MYVSAPIQAITGIIYLSNRTHLDNWKSKFHYDLDAIIRIEEYLERYNFVMEISEFHETNIIPLSRLKQDLTRFIIPQMYYYLDEIELGEYLEKYIVPTTMSIKNNFDNIDNNIICKN